MLPSTKAATAPPSHFAKFLMCLCPSVFPDRRLLGGQNTSAKGISGRFYASRCQGLSDAQTPSDQANDMQFRPDVCRGKARARLHGPPIARQRRPLPDLGAEADEFHAGEEHG